MIRAVIATLVAVTCGACATPPSSPNPSVATRHQETKASARDYVAGYVEVLDSGDLDRLGAYTRIQRRPDIEAQAQEIGTPRQGWRLKDARIEDAPSPHSWSVDYWVTNGTHTKKMPHLGLWFNDGHWEVLSKGIGLTPPPGAVTQTG